MTKVVRNNQSQQEKQMEKMGHSKYLPEVRVASGIPSGFKPYAPSSEIRYTPSTFGEITKLVSSQLSLSDKYKLILDSIETSFPKMEITLDDFLFISLLRKISTFPKSSFSIEHTCYECGAINIYRSSLDNIEFDDIKVDLPVIVKTSNFDLKFMPLTMAGFLDLLKKEQQDDEIAIIARQCTNYKFEEAYKIISSLSFIDDIESVREAVSSMSHGVAIIVNKCTECGADCNIDLDEEATIINPFREHK